MTEVTTPAAASAPPQCEPVVLFARQPILDAAGTVQGHELLFRRPDGTGWPIEDENQATAHVIVAAFADSGLGGVTGGTRAWINVSRGFLFETDLSVLPADRVVLELLERDRIDATFVAHAAALAQAGYQLALDDFSWHDDLEPLLELVTYVKLDVRALGLDGVAEHVERLAPFGMRLLAEKVETAEEQAACLEMGIDLFQGYFFERPRLVRGRPTPHAALRRLRVATSIGPNSTFEDVERVVTLDPGLSLRLLRYINSAALSLRSRVSSLRHALMLVGTNTVRQWILLVMFGDLGRVRPAVLSSALVRARLCETLARGAGLRATDSAFAVGLLSVVDALLDMPLDKVVETLPLTDEVSEAIVQRHGRLGELLSLAVALQHGAARVDQARSAALADAIAWSDEQLAAFTAV